MNTMLYEFPPEKIELGGSIVPLPSDVRACAHTTMRLAIPEENRLIEPRYFFEKLLKFMNQ